MKRLVVGDMSVKISEVFAHDRTGRVSSAAVAASSTQVCAEDEMRDIVYLCFVTPPDCPTQPERAEAFLTCFCRLRTCLRKRWNPPTGPTQEEIRERTEAVRSLPVCIAVASRVTGEQ